MHETTLIPSGLTMRGDGTNRSATVVVRGNLDRATAPHLQAGLDRLQGLGCRRVVVDLGAVPFVDAAGLAALFHAAKDARRHGNDVILRHASWPLWRMLAIM